VFIPVALNYDRVLEDRLLIGAARSGARRFPVRMRDAFAYVGKHLWQRMTRRFRRFGYAAVSFGAPVSLEATLRGEPDMSAERLAERLMARVRDAVPVLPLPLVAAVLQEAGGRIGRADLQARAEALVAHFAAQGSHVHLPDGATGRAVEAGLEALAIRRVIAEEDGAVRVIAEHADVIAFYANSISHLIAEDAVAPLIRDDAAALRET